MASIHDISLAASITGKLHVADQRNLGAPCLVRNSQRQARFWLHEQDLLCDLVWQMRMSCMDVEGCPELHDICLVNKTVLWHPNVFITTAAGECLLPSMFADLKLFRHVQEHVTRVEFQGRGTLHVHMALWALQEPLYLRCLPQHEPMEELD